MRFAIVPAAALATVLALVDVAAGQNQVKFAASRATAPHRTAQRVDLDGPVTPGLPTPAAPGEPVVVEEAAAAEVGGGYLPSEMTSQIAPGAAFSVDLRNIYPNQVWPGVPPCCDTWLGYCHEPRCYGCWKGQGYYTHYDTHHCDKCGGPGEYIQYRPGFNEKYRPAGTCVGAGCGSCGGCEGCPTCRPACYQPSGRAACTGNSCVTGPAADATPQGTSEPAAPRNELPKKAAGPTARRGVTRPST
ncbi:MAG: hypothetical protein HYX69_21080 [Planctomycetia bacterium]|nr:hypothetical protein [Planctomycetia bacterium]